MKARSPLFCLGAGYDNLNNRIETFRQCLQVKEALSIDVLRPDEEKYTILDCMGKKVIARKPPVRYKNRNAPIGISVGKVTYGAEFVLLAPRLDDAVKIPLVEQVKQ